METDTAGNIIYDPINCDCNSTGGCEKCNPFLSFISVFPLKPTNSLDKITDLINNFMRAG